MRRRGKISASGPPAAAPRRRASACAQPPLSRLAVVPDCCPGQSGERKEGQGSALKPARGLCPLDPQQRQRPLQSIHWSGCEGGGRTPQSVWRQSPPCRLWRSPPSLTPAQKEGSKGRCPWRGSKGQRPLVGSRGKAPGLPPFTRLPWTAVAPDWPCAGGHGTLAPARAACRGDGVR
jgi:hypothetical protein